MSLSESLAELKATIDSVNTNVSLKKEMEIQRKKLSQAQKQIVSLRKLFLALYPESPAKAKKEKKPETDESESEEKPETQNSEDEPMPEPPVLKREEIMKKPRVRKQRVLKNTN